MYDNFTANIKSIVYENIPHNHEQSIDVNHNLMTD